MSTKDQEHSQNNSQARNTACTCDAHQADVVNRVLANMPDEEFLADISSFFKVLGDNTRVRIVWALDEAEMCVCDLALTLNMTKSAISHQLRTLKDAKLVKDRRQGKNVFYSLDDDHVKDVFEKAVEHLKHL